MSKQLELKFLSSEGKTKTITVNEPKADLTVEQIQLEMDEIVAASLFDDEGVNPYTSVKSARYVTRTVEDIFDNQA